MHVLELSACLFLITPSSHFQVLLGTIALTGDRFRLLTVGRFHGFLVNSTVPERTFLSCITLAVDHRLEDSEHEATNHNDADDDDWNDDSKNND